MVSDQGPPDDGYGRSDNPPGVSHGRQPGFFSQPRNRDFPGGDQGYAPPGGGRWPVAGSTRRMLFRGVLVAGSFAIFAAIVWYAYQQGHQRGVDSTPPIIKADVNPNRVRPAAPGGMEVPHQDKMIYDRVSPEDEAPRVERLMPRPEAPVTRKPPEPPPVFPETGGLTDIPMPVMPDSEPPQLLLPEDPRAPQPLTTARQQQTIAPPPIVAPPPVAAPPAAPSATAPPPVASATPTPSSAAGLYKIQLGAFRSEKAAEMEWLRLQGRNTDILGKLNLTVQKVDLGAKGLFFRVQAGTYATEAAARSMCAELTRRKTPCLVVRP